MARVILVPLDGSKPAEEVLPHVEDLAHTLNADVLLLQVIDELQYSVHIAEFPSLELAHETAMAELTARRRKAERYLSALTEAWRAKGIYTSWRIVEGRPAREIVEVARMRGAYMLALCVRERSGLGRLLHGGVAKAVVKDLKDVPVLLVRTDLAIDGAVTRLLRRLRGGGDPGRPSTSRPSPADARCRPA